MNSRRSLPAVLAVVAFINAPLAAQSVWTVPGIVNSPGQNGTHFVSDLTICNPGTNPASIGISFFASTGRIDRPLTLSPGESRVFRNVVESLFGTAGAGILSISSDQPLLLRARTYNTAPSGTYGVALPVVSADRLLAPGDVADSLWISQDPSPSAGYRTNVAVVFPDASGGAAAVTVFDAEGAERGHQDFSLAAPGLQQFSVSGFAGAVPVGRARIVVTRGHAAGYASVVDNVTGDSSLFTFEGLPAGRQDVLVNGVARANGKNGTFFRTDGRFYNPTDTDATVTVAFHASGIANPSPASASFALPAGKVRDVVDILDALLGLPVGSAGALRFTSDWPIAILCRTSNVDPTGARPGTFGAQQSAVPLLSFLSSADAGVLVTGVRQDADFRTNVALAAGADGATAQFTLKTADGVTVGTATEALGAFGWWQSAVDKLFSVGIPADAEIHVKLTEGSVDVFDSSVDNASGDSVVTPAQALPAAIPSSANIGRDGGSIRSDDGRLTLRIPAGALASDVTISLVTNASNDAPLGTGASYTLSPGGLAFAKTTTLVSRYSSDDLDGSAAGELGLAFRSGAAWFVRTGGSVNAAARTLTVPIDSTSPAVNAAPQSVRTAAAPTPDDWALFNSLVVSPGYYGIPTGGKRTLTLASTGPSSSSQGPGSHELPKPIYSNEFPTAWYVNGKLLGNAEDGRVVDLGHGLAQYLAPKCVPPINPAIVAVRVSIGGVGWYASHDLAAKVLVVPRDWQLKGTLVHNASCQEAIVADYAVYTSGFYFGLDDSLALMDPYPLLPTREYGNATACEPYTAAKRTTDNDLDIEFVSGYYDPRRQEFHVFLKAQVPVMPGYTVLDSDGKTPENFDPIVVEIPPIPEVFKESTETSSAGTFANMTVDLHRVTPSGCP